MKYGEKFQLLLAILLINYDALNPQRMHAMMHETGESMRPNKDPKKNDILCRVSNSLISFFTKCIDNGSEPKKKLYRIIIINQTDISKLNIFWIDYLDSRTVERISMV